MQFSPDLREAVTSGRITVSFRLWQRPQVKVAGRYAIGSVRIEIDSIEMMPFRAVTAEDVRRSGERDRESLRARAAHAGPIGEATLLYRVEFHVVDEGRLDREHRQRTGSTHAVHVDVASGVATDLPNPDNDPRVAPVSLPDQR